MNLRRDHTTAFLSRVMRSAVMRIVMVVVMVPMLVAGSFGGTAIVAHSHHGHGLHVHAGLTDKAALRVAAEHVLHHDHGCHPAPCESRPAEAPCDGRAAQGAGESPTSPGGVLITIPDHDHLAGRAVTLPSASIRFVGFADRVVAAAVWIAVWNAAMPAPPPDRGQWCGPPRHLAALSGCERLVCTSLALLI